MERDALSAGVERGGLYNTADIKMLICYLLSRLKMPVPYLKLANALHYEGIANYFEVSNAFSNLEESGQVKLIKSNDDDLYQITKSGEEIAETLQSSLSRTVRDKAYKVALRLMVRHKNEQENDIFIEKTENGYIVSCSVMEKNNEMMTIRLVAPDAQVADFIKQSFLDDAANIYSSLIEIITNPKNREK